MQRESAVPPSLARRPDSGSPSKQQQAQHPRRDDPHYSNHTAMTARPQAGVEHFEHAGSSSGESHIDIVYNPMPRPSIDDEVKKLAKNGGLDPNKITKDVDPPILSKAALDIKLKPWQHTAPDKIDALLWDNIKDEKAKQLMWKWFNEINTTQD